MGSPGARHPLAYASEAVVVAARRAVQMANYLRGILVVLAALTSQDKPELGN